MGIFSSLKNRLLILGVATFVFFLALFHIVDLSGVPAFSVIKLCMPEDRIVTLVYKIVLAVNLSVPLILAIYLRPTKVFSELSHLFSSGLLFLIISAGMYLGIPVQRSDGAGEVFSNLFCESAVGSTFVILLVGLGAFFCILYFIYVCKSFYSFKVKGV